MRMCEFIRTHRIEIDKIISCELSEEYFSGNRNDADREEWIENNTALYNLAKSCGVKV